MQSPALVRITKDQKHVSTICFPVLLVRMENTQVDGLKRTPSNQILVAGLSDKAESEHIALGHRLNWGLLLSFLEPR